MATDLEIARSVKGRPIADVAADLGLHPQDLVPFGYDKAKILRDPDEAPKGKLILVSAITPTPAGEGKTTTSVGLAQGLGKIGKNACVVLREPSLGPCLGMKGGAAGGGHSQVIPMEDINLHFTGDFHAITTAHNLLSALIDNHLKHGNETKLDPSRISWPRVVDMNDRALRNITVGKGGPANGHVREDRFDITAASEVMAILVLASDYGDLRRRLGEIVVGTSTEGHPVKADDIGGAGAMALLLRQAFLPNLTQTLEGDPAFIHGGPFANIAHGNSSIIGDRMALASADFVITEAGFGSDMGAEKFMHIKAATSGKGPDCVVMNVTVRSMKLHGGAFGDRGGIRPDKKTLEAENVEAVSLGARTNLDRHIRNMASFGVPVVVSINKFASDTDAEIAAITGLAHESGAKAVCVTEVHARGGDGGKDLAEAVVRAVQNHIADGRPFVPLFTAKTDVLEKANQIATRMYKAEGLELTNKAKRELERIRSWGYGHLPVCMAKTQYSFSHDAGLLGAPSGFTVPVREFRLNAGAGFIVAVLGDMMTMPGLPKRPAALDMDMDEDGNLLGVFG